MSRAVIKFNPEYSNVMPTLTGPTFVRYVKYDTGKNRIKIGLWTEGEEWETTRPYTQQKYDYYEDLLGQEVRVEVSNGKKGK